MSNWHNSNDSSRVLALIPAGGSSARMGRPKLLLPWKGRTILEHVVATLRNAGIEQVLVVAAPSVPELAEIAREGGAAAVLLPAETPDMRATVTYGLQWMEANWSPSSNDFWLLAPADHPTLSTAIVRALLEARNQRPAQSLFVPTCAGRRGHPTLIGWRHVPALRAFPDGQGLNQYLREQAAVEVPLHDPGVLQDLDTPEEYQRLVSGE